MNDAPLEPTEILVSLGTRPEAIKLIPVIHALEASEDFTPVVVSTGQHHQMVAELFELAGVEIETELWAGPPDAKLNEIVPSVMRRFDDFYLTRFGEREEGAAREGKAPAAVIVHGDTSSALAAALAAFHLRVPVIHAEAGLRTGGNNLSPFPEELNRQLLSCIAAFHLAPTARNKENLVREQIAFDQIYVTGNTAIDALRWAAGLKRPYTDPALAELEDSGRQYVIVTAHRRENWDRLEGIAAGITRLAEAYPEISFVIPLHPNPLVRERLGEPISSLENTILTEPVPYAEFARLIAGAKLILTDSGGIQEEAPSLGVPVLVLRDSTERTEGIDAGTLRLVGTEPELIFAAGTELLSDLVSYRAMSEAHNPYGDGRAAERIVDALANLRDGGAAPAPYGPGYARQAVLRAAGYAELAGERGRSDGRSVAELWHPGELDG